MNFDLLWNAFNWSPIPRCPGRFVAPRDAGTRPLQMVQDAGIAVTEHRPVAARDTVLVAVFDGGGLLSYRRADGSCRHTLNTPEGLQRKLLQLGIAPGHTAGIEQENSLVHAIC